jgi:hypothetical protein
MDTGADQCLCQPRYSGIPVLIACFTMPKARATAPHRHRVAAAPGHPGGPAGWPVAIGITTIGTQPLIVFSGVFSLV